MNPDYLKTITSRNILVITAIICFAFLPLAAQSTDQNNPTPITSDRINGTITARDIGDSRLTTYYYLFRGNRGDVFINVVTSNINGTIDLFSKNGLRPRTKITLFADAEENETGRVVYMRESELLILRIQGRSPNDDPGTYQFKFAGAFSPLAELPDDENDPVASGGEGSVTVNSVGTIVRNPDKIIPSVKESTREEPKIEIESAPSENKPGIETQVAITADSKKETQTTPGSLKKKIESNETAVERSEGVPAKKTSAEATDPAGEFTVEIGGKRPRRSALVTISREPDSSGDAGLAQKLADVTLRVELKNGTSILRPMNEVLSVNVIKGILTIVTTDGNITEFSILDVLKMTIE